MTASKDSAYATGKNVCLYLFLGPLEGKPDGSMKRGQTEALLAKQN